MYRNLQLPLATLAVVLTMFTVSTAPASAHGNAVYHGYDYAYTNSGHGSGEVCDAEYDGNFVVAYWYNADGDKIAYEEVGGYGDCNGVNWSGTATGVKVCEIDPNGPDDCTRIHKT
jgi:hypothetical protein